MGSSAFLLGFLTMVPSCGIMGLIDQDPGAIEVWLIHRFQTGNLIRCVFLNFSGYRCSEYTVSVCVCMYNMYIVAYSIVLLCGICEIDV